MGRDDFSVVLALRRAASRVAGILRLPGRQRRLAAKFAGGTPCDRSSSSDAASRDRWRRKRSLAVVVAWLVPGADGIGCRDGFAPLAGPADTAVRNGSLRGNCSHAVAWCDAALARGHRLHRNLAPRAAAFFADLPKLGRCRRDGDGAVPGPP